MYDEFEQWMCERGRLSPKTAHQYRGRIVQAIETLGFDPRKHDDRQTERFVFDRVGSPSNQDHWVSALRRFQEYCIDSGETVNFADRLQSRRRPERLPRPVQYGDLYKLLETIDVTIPLGIRNRAICELLYCGLRNEEVCSTNVVDFLNREVRIIGKNNKERIVPLNDEAWFWIITHAVSFHGQTEPLKEEELEEQFSELLKNVNPETPMFLSDYGNRVDGVTLRRIIEAAKNNAGLDYRITPHMLRHSFATHLLDEGMEDLEALRNVMGHENIGTLLHYVKTSTRRRNRLIQFHPRQRKIEPVVK